MAIEREVNESNTNLLGDETSGLIRDYAPNTEV